MFHPFETPPPGQLIDLSFRHLQNGCYFAHRQDFIRHVLLLMDGAISSFYFSAVEVGLEDNAGRLDSSLMNTKLIRALVEFVKTEEQSRATARESMPPEAAYDHAMFYDNPLTHELYFLVLLFMWHDIEKEIVLASARSGEQDSGPMSRDDFRKEVERLAGLSFDKRRIEIEKRLPTLDRTSWELLDLLRLVANSFKHDPFDKPNHRLLKHLSLAPNMNYATLAESGAVRYGLARLLGIGDDAPFAEIVEEIRKRCDRIVFMLHTGIHLRAFKDERVSLNPSTFER